MPGSVSKNIVASYANLKPVAAGELRSLTMLGVPVTLRAAVSHVTPSFMSAGSLSAWEYAYQKAAAIWSGGELVIEGMQISRNGALYERIGTGVTEATFDTIESLFWVEVAGEDTINDYPASTAVAVGQTCRVTYGTASVFLRNTVAHDTASTFTAVEAANWQYVGQSVTGSFAAATVVVAGTRMSQDGNQYTRNATGTTAATFSAVEATNWTAISLSPFSAWAANRWYTAGELTLTPAGAVVRKLAAGMSGATFDATEAALWLPLLPADLASYTPSVYYFVGDKIAQGQRTLVRSVAGLGALTFSSVEAANWSAYASGTPAWSAATYFFAGDQVTHLGRVLEKLANGLSTATFDAAEGVLWSLVEAPAARSWVATKYYYANEQALTTDKLTIVRTTGGLSATTFTNAEAANWTSVSWQWPTWAATTFYFINQTVLHLGRAIRRTAADGISGATFDTTEGGNWTFSSQQYVKAFTVGQYYFANESANYNGAVLARTGTAGISTAMDATEAAKWTISTTETPVAWAAATYYFAGQQVLHLGRFLSRASGGTSGATFDGTEGPLWNLIEAPSARSWVASKYYYLLEQVRDPNGLLVERAAAGLSGASFNATEAAFWTTCFDSYKTWAATDYIYQYQVVRHSGRLLQRTSASGVAGATFDATEGAKYNRLASETVAAYSSNFYYYFNEQATHRGLVLTRTTAGLTSTALDVTEATRWFATDTQTPMPFSGTTYYFDGQLIDNAGVIYRRNSATAGLSATTFTLVESGNWTRVTAGADVSAWLANIYVAAGEVRTTTYGGVTVYIRCTTSHLTAATFTVVEAANWSYVSQASIAAFTASAVVLAGIRILHLGRLLERTATGTTTAAFDVTEGPTWTLIEAPPARDWVAGKYYYLEEQAITPTAATVRRIAAGLSTGTFDVTEAVDWVMVDSANPVAWIATAYYYANQQAISTITMPIRRIAGGLSGASFDNTERALWTGVIHGIATWSAVTYLYANQTMIHDGRVIRKNTANSLTGATFDATEGANFAFVAQQDVRAFSVGRYYYVGEQAIYLGLTMTRNTAGVSTAIDATEAGKWTATTTQTAMPLVFSAYYFAGHTVTHLGHIWSRTAGGTIGLLFDAAEALLWSRVTGDNITTAWAATQLIDLHEIKVATVAGVTCLLRCETQHYSVATLTQAELNNFSVVSQLNPGTWSAAMPILPGVLLLEDGVTYKRGTAGPTGGAFNAAERANYSLVASTTKIETFTGSGTAIRFDGYATCNPTAAMTLTLPEQVTSDIGRKYTINNVSAFDVTVAVTVGGIVSDTIVKAYSVRTFLVTTITNIVLAEAYKPYLALKAVVANYTALATDDVIMVDSTAASVTVTLPVTFNVGKLLVIHKTAAANSLIVAAGAASSQVSTGGVVVASETFANQFTNLPYFWTGTVWTFYA